MVCRSFRHHQRGAAHLGPALAPGHAAAGGGTLATGLLVLALLAGCGPGGPPPAPSAAAAPATPPGRASPAVEAVPATSAPVPVAEVAPAPPLESLPGESAPCLARSASPAPASVAVHRWVDAAGITHYADRPPAGEVSDHRVLAVSGLPPIRVEARGHDVNLPQHLEARAVADALGVQRVLRDALGVAVPPGLVLRIVFVRGQEAWNALVGSGAVAGAAGAYSPALQAIRVRMQEDTEASFVILRHEITHAIVHEAVGNLPLPVNEGLAEYFARYRVAGQGGEVDLRREAPALRAAAPAGDGSEALVDLLARDGSEFYAAADQQTRERRYRQVHGLVALLMRDAGGRAALAALLAAQRQEPCTPVAAEQLLERHYRGGLRQLASDWAAFMRDPPTVPQSW